MLAIILLFTQNLLISLYTMLTIVLIVITLMGFLFAVAGFTFGAIEAVGVTIFVGMSVDYCLFDLRPVRASHRCKLGAEAAAGKREREI